MASPFISSLSPNSAQQDWEGTVAIHGSGFDNGSFALFSGKVPKTNFKSDALLEAEITREITATTGTKEVKVHSAGGEVSNSKDFEVRPKQR